MLNAILNSKSGRLQSGGEQSIRWRDLFRGSEDLLTATVFERLSYLPSSVAWGLLVGAAAGQLRAFQVAELHDIQFWPMWAADGRVRGVEPDIFLAFDVGDPTLRVEVVLEAKHGGAQYEYQWAEEIRAWAEAIFDSEMSPPDLLILMAVGGNSDWQKRDERLADFIEATRSRHPTLPELSVVMISWPDLARACAAFLFGADNSAPSHEKRIVQDIGRALELCGYFHRVRPMQLEQLAQAGSFAGTLNAFMASNENASKRVRKIEVE